MTKKELQDAALIHSAAVNILGENVADLQAELLDLTEAIDTITEAVALAEKCLKESVEKRAFLESIQTDCLSATYDTDVQFFLDTVEDKGIIKGLEIKVSIDGGPKLDPHEMTGSGMEAVISFVFRICVAIFTGQRFLMIDEPVGNLPDFRWRRLADVATDLCHHSDLQLVTITHFKPIGKVYWVEQTNGLSIVAEADSNSVELRRSQLLVD